MLVNCVAYEKGRRSSDLQISEVREWLDHHSGFVWVALRDPDEDEIARAKAAFQLPDEAIAEARRFSQRPIVAEYYQRCIGEDLGDATRGITLKAS